MPEHSHQRPESGFSLVELILAMMVGSLVMGGMLGLLRNVQVVDADVGARAETHQGARVALDWLQRDLLRAGIGYSEMVALFPMVLPTADGGIEIRTNPSGFRASLTSDLAAGATTLALDDVTGLAPGSHITVFDASGGVETFAVRGLGTSGRRGDGTPTVLLATPAARAFTVANGAAAADLEQIRYRTEVSGGETRLIRQVNDEFATVATGITAFTVTYLDDSAPPSAFDPTTTASQMRIRAVQVLLRLSATGPRLGGNGASAVAEHTVRVVPRVLAMRSH